MGFFMCNDEVWVEREGRWSRFNKKTRPGPEFPPMNPKGGKKKTKKGKKY